MPDIPVGVPIDTGTLIMGAASIRVALPEAEGLLVISPEPCSACQNREASLFAGIVGSSSQCHACAGTGRKLVPISEVLEPILLALARR